MVKATIEIGLIDNVTKGVNDINKSMGTLKKVITGFGAAAVFRELTRVISGAVKVLGDFEVAGTQVASSIDSLKKNTSELIARHIQNNEIVKKATGFLAGFVKGLNDSAKASGLLLEKETEAGKKRIAEYNKQKGVRKKDDDDKNKLREQQLDELKDFNKKIAKVEEDEIDRQNKNRQEKNKEDFENDLSAYEEKKQAQKDVLNEISNFAESTGQSIASSLDQGLEASGESLRNFLLSSVKGWVGAQIGMMLSSAFTSAGVSLGFIPAAAAAGSSAEGLISSLPFKAEQGGIVPGNSYSGDRVPARMNSGEMVLTREDQASLLNMIRGGGAGRAVDVTLNIDGAKLARILAKTDAKIARGMA